MLHGIEEWRRNSCAAAFCRLFGGLSCQSSERPIRRIAREVHMQLTNQEICLRYCQSGGVIPSKRHVFIGCSWYCEPGWSMGSCHDVMQTESSFGVIFVAFDLSNFFKWLFGWAGITVMARQSIGLMHRCTADVAMSVVRCCRGRLWRETT